MATEPDEYEKAVEIARDAAYVAYLAIALDHVDAPHHHKFALEAALQVRKIQEAEAAEDGPA